MKKILYFLIMIGLVTTSCAKSPEDKANILIEREIKSWLFKPNTYENVITDVDSAYTPYCDPKFHEMLLKLNRLSKRIEECDRKIEKEKSGASSAKSLMDVNSNGYGAFSRNQYQHYKEKYEQHNQKIQEIVKKKDALVTKKEKLYNKIQAEISQKPQFIGFQAIHRYRADDNAGQTMLSDAYFVFDKDFSQILLGYDTDSDDFKAIDKMIEEFKDEQE